MKYSPLLEDLIESLRCLPGVGRKSAQRMAFHLLERDRGGARALSRALGDAADKMGHCKRCRMFSELELCELCSTPRRDDSLLCVVETPADVVAVEQTASFSGRYFVLMGHLSPLDGIGPDELGLDLLETRLKEGLINEMIVATNPTVEGEATAHYLSEMASQSQVRVSRIAHGVPIGGELEFVDAGTLSHAIAGRQVLD